MANKKLGLLGLAFILLSCEGIDLSERIYTGEVKYRFCFLMDKQNGKRANDLDFEVNLVLFEKQNPQKFYSFEYSGSTDEDGTACFSIENDEITNQIDIESSSLEIWEARAELVVDGIVDVRDHIPLRIDNDVTPVYHDDEFLFFEGTYRIWFDFERQREPRTKICSILREPVDYNGNEITESDYENQPFYYESEYTLNIRASRNDEVLIDTFAPGVPGFSGVTDENGYDCVTLDQNNLLEFDSDGKPHLKHTDIDLEVSSTHFIYNQVMGEIRVEDQTSMGCCDIDGNFTLEGDYYIYVSFLPLGKTKEQYCEENQSSLGPEFLFQKGCLTEEEYCNALIEVGDFRNAVDQSCIPEPMLGGYEFCTVIQGSFSLFDQAPSLESRVTDLFNNTSLVYNQTAVSQDEQVHCNEVTPESPFLLKHNAYLDLLENLENVSIDIMTLEGLILGEPQIWQAHLFRVLGSLSLDEKTGTYVKRFRLEAHFDLSQPVDPKASVQIDLQDDPL
ncbi:MAG: hypothetical protein CL678_13615 [Bdellovibrionaceae bacterium]|nr:hypothetical protein [Pseudobdellovibrionaceae bacterium]